MQVGHHIRLPGRLRYAVTLILVVVVTTGANGGDAAAQVFLKDDPILVDPDTIALPAPPGEFPISDAFNALQVTFASPARWEGEALNVNTLGNVPESSWYEPRIHAREMSLTELARGPNRTGGPADGRWHVIDLKTEGVTPGLTIRDERGDIYLMKFDSPRHPAMASGPEAIATKIFYALGYHVPENYVVMFDRDRMVADTSEGITPADIDSLVSGLTSYGNGHRRALASLFLSGRPIGPFTYAGRRSDDPNDLYPHEARRELRGMRLVAAWLEHFDSRAQNTLDMVVEQSGGSGTYIKHHLIDFGSTLGGGALGPKRLWYGHEFAVDVGPILVRAVTLGFGASDWVDFEYPEIPYVGRYTSRYFDPATWKPAFPNPAFERMDDRDAFWMAKQIVKISDEALGAIVETAQYPNPAAASYVEKILRERRDQITQAYLGFGGGIDRFRIGESPDGPTLVFDDLLEFITTDTSSAGRKYAWYAFDNDRSTVSDLIIDERLAEGSTTENVIPLPLPDSEFAVLEITTPGRGSTRVFVRVNEGQFKVMGVQRRNEGEPYARGWG